MARIVGQGTVFDITLPDIKPIGVKTIRAAIGARIKLAVEVVAHQPRDIHRRVWSGGSFGASPLEQFIGVGKATRIETLEICWPPGEMRQTLHNVGLNQHIEVQELAEGYTQQTTRPTKPMHAGRDPSLSKAAARTRKPSPGMWANCRQSI